MNSLPRPEGTRRGITQPSIHNLPECWTVIWLIHLLQLSNPDDDDNDSNTSSSSRSSADMPPLAPPTSENNLVRPPALCLQPPTPVPISAGSPGLTTPFLSSSSSSFNNSQTLSVQPEQNPKPTSSGGGTVRATRQRTVSASECDARSSSLPPDPLRSSNAAAANSLKSSFKIPENSPGIPENSPLVPGSSRSEQLRSAAHNINNDRPTRHRSLLSLLMRKTVEELQVTNNPLAFRCRSAESGDVEGEAAAAAAIQGDSSALRPGLG